MSDVGSVTNPSGPMLFSFKGSIVVCYLDGTTMEGEFLTQDAYNIFLKTTAESIMIPRQQIRYIKAKENQPVEKDTSQAPILSDAISTEPIPPREVPQAVAPPSDQSGEEEDDGTLILVTDQAATPAVVEEDDEDEGTLIIGPEAGQSTPVAASEAGKEEPLDMTVVLGDNISLPPDIATAAPGAQTGEVIARLKCIAGPHAGDSFTLSTGITSIGRSSDNTIVLSSDKEVSRHHAIILFELGKYVVQDQNSLNGTFVNDKQITGPYYLENGDTFLTGLSSFQYEES